jgi:hypothetical protein
VLLPVSSEQYLKGSGAGTISLLVILSAKSPLRVCDDIPKPAVSLNLLIGRKISAFSGK